MRNAHSPSDAPSRIAAMASNAAPHASAATRALAEPVTYALARASTPAPRIARTSAVTGLTCVPLSGSPLSAGSGDHQLAKPATPSSSVRYPDSRGMLETLGSRMLDSSVDGENREGTVSNHQRFPKAKRIAIRRRGRSTAVAETYP